MSFMRANFCSKLMNYAKDMPISKPDAYLMGMFSTLNYLIDAPLAEILKPIPLCAEAKEPFYSIPAGLECCTIWP